MLRAKGPLLLLAVLTGARATTPDARGLRLGNAAAESLGAMTFGPDGTLFIADQKAAALYAFDPDDRGTASFGERALAPGLDRKVAALLGTTADRIRFRDMAVHPKSRNVYLTVAREDDQAEQPALVRIKGPNAIELVDLRNIKFATTPIPEAPSRDAKTPWGQPQWTMAVTDLAFADGQLYVAGLSNEQFASALRRVPFPFGKSGSINTVEIFHTSHDKWETAAPISAFVPLTVGGTPMILAGYGCSPIATFDRAALATNKHLRGRTVAELGGGNRPVDLITYRRNGQDWVLIANSHRTLMRIAVDEIAKAPAMTKAVDQAYEPGGLGYLPIASSGVMHIADLGEEYVAVLQRDVESGSVDLVAMSKKWL
jgi:hypothetical protein